MKVYFDDDGVLRHFGCEGHVLVDVEAWYRRLPVTDVDGSWDLGEFEAHIELHDNALSNCTIMLAQCGECKTLMTSSAGVKGLKLVTEDEYDKEYKLWVVDQIEEVTHEIGCSLSANIFYDSEDFGDDSYTAQREALFSEYNTLHRLVEQLVAMKGVKSDD